MTKEAVGMTTYLKMMTPLKTLDTRQSSTLRGHLVASAVSRTQIGVAHQVVS